MKKFILFLLILIIFLYGCQNSYKDNTTAQKSVKSLSDMQATACNAANDAGTCGTRLQELGIVSKEDCCRALGKCC